MGTLRKLPSGQWRARIRIHRRIRSKTAEKPLAEEWLRAQRRAKVLEEAGIDRPVESRVDVTFAELQAGYLDHIAQVGSLGRRKRRHTPGTIENYKHDVRQVLEHWGSRIVRATTTADVEDFELRLRARKLSTSTIRHRLDRLAQLMQFAVRRGYLSRVPCPVERPAMILASRPHATSEAELEQLLDRVTASGDPRGLPIVLLASDAGLRREEILRLRGVDVDLEAREGCLGWIHVAVDGEDFRTKSGHGRNVPIFTQRLRAALDVARFAGEGRVVRGLETKWGVSQLAQRHGVRLHDLRRRFATRLGSTGSPAPKIQRWMGHADLATTQKYMIVDDLPIAAVLSPREALEGATATGAKGQRA